MLEEPQRMRSNVPYSYIDLRSIAAAKGRSQRMLMEHPQPVQSMNSKTNMKVLFVIFLADTPNKPSMGSTLPKKKVLILTSIS